MSDERIERLRVAFHGRYTIERELGRGGMARVYLAEDLRHERSVALKVLEPELAAVVGAERFTAEIKTTAGLQHPHILPLFDSGEADGLLFYVMPYVEGESLRERLARERQLPVEEAVVLARKLAGALHTAHQAGVVHRDVKPGNILLAGGEPLIADFGIALALDAGAGQRLTETGLSLGTPHYMAPEQATGDQYVGPAADVYALGCVLYESLTGEPPFGGSTAHAVLGRILSSEAAPMTETRPSVPRHVEEAVQTALQKTPADRFRSAGDLAAALEDEGYRGSRAEDESAGSAGAWRRIATGSAALAVMALVLAGWALLRPPSDRPHFRVPVRFPDDQALSGAGHFDLSADGSILVYQGVDRSGLTQLWVRRADALDATPIAGTEGLSPSIVPDISISPDGEEVVFFRGGSFHVVPITGGTPREVADSIWGTTRWSPDGEWIYMRRLPAPGISRVPAEGGAPVVVTRLDTLARETGHVWPEILPDGESLVFEARGSAGPRIKGTRLGSDETVDIVEGRYPRYTDGRLLFMSEDGNTVLTAELDPGSFELSEEPQPLVTGLSPRGRSLAGSYGYAISQNGILAYAPERKWRMTWVTRGGATRTVDPDWVLGDMPGPWALSPDGGRVAFRRVASGAGDVWVKELDRGPETRITSTPGEERPVAWLDEETLLMLGEGATGLDLWSVRADGADAPRLLYDGPMGIASASVDPVGEWAAFTSGIEAFAPDGPVGADVFSLRLSEEPAVQRILESEGFVAAGVRLDPTGRFLAYLSSATGRTEVVLRPFPNLEDGRVQVSLASGSRPVWSAEGSRLYFVNGERQLVEAEIVGLQPLRVSRRSLFELSHEMASSFDIAPSGELLMVRSEPELVLIFDWTEIVE